MWVCPDVTLKTESQREAAGAFQQPDIGVRDIGDMQKVALDGEVAPRNSGSASPASIRAIWAAKDGSTNRSSCPGPVWLKARAIMRLDDEESASRSINSAASLEAA